MTNSGLVLTQFILLVHKGKMRFCFIISILSLLLAQSASAAAYKEWWSSARGMGMGGAYSSVVRDADAIFLNPAALARVSGVSWTPIDPRFGVNNLGVMTEYQAFQESEDIAAYVDSRWGEQTWAGGGVKSAVIFPYFGMAAFGATDLSMFSENPANPVVSLDYSADYGAVIAGAIDLIPTVMSFGMSAKRITRVGTSYPLRASTVVDVDEDEIQQELKNRGSGYGLDAAILVTLPTPIKPSFAMVYKNIGYTAFNHEGGMRAPARIAPDLTIAGSLEIDAPLITITPAFELKHVMDTETQIGKKLHLGVEVDLPLIDIRAGLHQGYYALGAGFDIGVMRADLATYGVELGEYPGQHEDRRYMAQVTFEIGFDLGNFSGKDSKTGKRIRLKQRR